MNPITPLLYRGVMGSLKKKEDVKVLFLFYMAQVVGFEPTEPFDSTVFKTVTIIHSDIPAYN